MKGNFLSSLIGHVREQKINKTSCGFVLTAHWQRIQTTYEWMHACVCVILFQKQLQHIVNMSMITKEKYLLNSFPAFDRFLSIYCYMVGGAITHILKEYSISGSKR